MFKHKDLCWNKVIYWISILQTRQYGFPKRPLPLPYGAQKFSWAGGDHAVESFRVSCCLFRPRQWCTGNRCSEQLKVFQFSVLWLMKSRLEQLVRRIHNRPLCPVNRSHGTNGTVRFPGLRAGRHDIFHSATPRVPSSDYWVRLRSVLSIRNPADIPGISAWPTADPLISTSQRLLHLHLQKKKFFLKTELLLSLVVCGSLFGD